MDKVLQMITQAEFDAHYIIIYSSVTTMRQIYLRYIKSQIEDNNGVVFILPYYETCENLT